MDYVFTNHGSLWLCQPKSDEARRHLEEHVDAEAQWWAGALAVEPRYVQGLVEALRTEGFTCTREGK